MMATKPRPSNDTTVEEEETPQVLSTDDKQADIERRLAMLGVPEETTSEEEEENEEAKDSEPEPEAPPMVVEEVAPPKEEETIPAPVPPTMTEAEEPKVELPVVKPVQPIEKAPEMKQPVVKAPTPASKSNKSALLARIMAAQERAKQQQMNQASQETTSMEFEKDKMLRALNGITDEKPKQPPPMTFQPPPPPAVKQKDTNPPPPSFEMFEMQMQQKPMAPPPPPETFMAPPSLDTFMAPPVPAPVMAPVHTAPPTFDSLSFDVFEAPPMASAPTAPPVEAPAPDLLGNFGGIMPVPVAPPMVETENAVVDEVFGSELDGLGLSAEEKQKMIEEQRAIMEQIAKESSNEKASMAAIKADAFAARMTGSGPAVQSVDGFTTSEVEEQRKILEQIEKEKSSSTAAQKSASSSSGQSVDIGGGQKVTLHGTEKTQESIDQGTASLVLCLNCNNWLQVAESATLMFCPICSVVSPVVKQDEIMSKEEILQMEEDRKLAERLQAEAYGDEDGDVSDYPANRRRATARAAPAAPARAGEKSWWDTINNAMVSVGIASAEPEEEKRSAEINTRGAPGMYSVTTGEEGGEREGLLGSGGAGDDYPMGRVAQDKPLFSCVVDSISNTANMMSGADEDEVHGVDTTSFLARPNIGREKNESSGSYYAVPEHD